jgi:hypothetical protein
MSKYLLLLKEIKAVEAEGDALLTAQQVPAPAPAAMLRQKARQPRTLHRARRPDHAVEQGDVFLPRTARSSGWRRSQTSFCSLSVRLESC